MKQTGNTVLAFDKASARTFDKDGRFPADKVCRKCCQLLPVEKFSKRSASFDGLQMKCKDCCAVDKKKWIAKNPEKIREYNKKVWANKTEEQHQKICASKRARYYKHKDRILEKQLAWQKANKEKVNKKNSEWAKRNPLQGYVKHARRVAAKKSATVSWSDEFMIEFIYKAARDMTEMYGVKYDVDHIVPLQSKIVCGLHCEANMQVIPRSVNASKGNKFWPDMPQ